MIDYAMRLIMKKGMDGIASIEKNISKQVKFYNGKIEIVKEWETKIMNIFMAKKDKKIAFSIDDPNKQKIADYIEKNEKIMETMAPSEYYGIQEKYGYKNLKEFDKRVIENDRLIEIAESAISHGGEISGIVLSSIDDIEIANSNGVEENDKNSMIYLSTRAFHEEKSAHDVSCGRSIDAIDTRIAYEANNLAKEGKEKLKIKEGKYDVIFYPMAFANLVSQFASFSSAFYVDAGYSFLVDKIGKRVANEIITISDDGIKKDGMASRKFDDEGNATQVTTIIENGILKNYLHNSTTAIKYRTITTGNAGIMAAAPWNTIVKGGDYGLDEMFEGFNGIIITNLWYTRFQNYRNGDFSSVARDAAFYLKNGKKYLIKGIRISDNIENIFKNIEIISKEQKQIFWWEVENPVFAPYAMAREVKITTPKT